MRGPHNSLAYFVLVESEGYLSHWRIVLTGGTGLAASGSFEVTGLTIGTGNLYSLDANELACTREVDVVEVFRQFEVTDDRYIPQKLLLLLVEVILIVVIAGVGAAGLDGRLP